MADMQGWLWDMRWLLISWWLLSVAAPFVAYWLFKAFG